MGLFIDGHCHPTLKRYLFGYSFFSGGRPRKDNAYTNIVVTLPALQKGELDSVIAFHYLPEKPILQQWRTVRVASPVLNTFLRKYVEKVEGEDAFQETLDLIDEFETHIATGSGCVVARNFAEFKTARDAGEKVILQALEGGHHLGRDLSADVYKNHIGVLKEKGIAVITLSHFFPNNITSPIEGIPPSTKRELGVAYVPDPEIPLAKLGKLIINAIWDAGILIDLTHTCPHQRSEIFEMNRLRQGGMRPLLFTHVGVRALFEDDNHPSFGLMAPDDDEIKSIQDCGGVVGIIFMRYWLNGKEEPILDGNDYGYDLIVSTIKHIHDITGNFDHISIGTDFDGMTDPFDDYYEPGMLADFKNRLMDDRERIEATPEDIEKITGGNLLRVLQNGWT